MNVLWLSLHLHVPARGYWDQAIVDDLLAGRVWRPAGWPEIVHTEDARHATPGSVIVLNGSAHGNNLDELNVILDRARPCVLVVLEDEESVFPWRGLNLDRVSLWVQNSRPDRHDGNERGIPVGWSPGVRAAKLEAPYEKPLDWFFAGQVTHRDRKLCVQALRDLPGGEIVATRQFLDQDPAALRPAEYLRRLATAKLAPCPGGRVTPDSFRVWEALELGCIPLAGTHGGHGKVEGYWPHLVRGPIAFPLIDDWGTAPALMRGMLDEWPRSSNRVQSWWRGWQRSFAYRFLDDVRPWGAASATRPGDRLTVLVPTSPIPGHPSTEIVDEVLASIHSRPELAGCETLILCDGVRQEQADRSGAYEEYLRRLLQLTRRYRNVWPIVFDKHMHQAAMTHAALAHVRTPAVLFVEHDTPLVGEIPFEPLIDAVLSEADVVRLHHETHVLDVHQYLMLDCDPKPVAGLPMLRTVQWSQRPHLANAGFYRRILAEDFDLPRERWMIEPRMYSVVQDAWRKHGEAGWNRYRLWMYAPVGNIQRSTHLDGRAGAQSWETA